MATITMEEFVDNEVTEAAKKALDVEQPSFTAVQTFLNWMREKVANFFTHIIKELPVVGTWSSRIGVSVSEFVAIVVETLIGLLKTVFYTQTAWIAAHNAAMKAWTKNEDNGLTAQLYAYSKKMAGYFLEIIKQCFERAIRVKGLEVDDEEKTEITSMLDSLRKTY